MDFTVVIYEDIEPKVIDNELLRQVTEISADDNDDKKVLRQYNTNFNEIKQLRIEYKNIYKIDHLWMYTNLTQLNLSNNLIEKIENLHDLINLRDLNLSYNRIMKIENLTTLTQLEILSLYSNCIEVIENLDALENLSILTIGKNRIATLESVHYLRLFDHLKSLNMEENPCCDGFESPGNFQLYVSGLLPNLTYYNYKIIQASDRNKANELYGNDIKMIEKQQKTDLRFLQKLEKITLAHKEIDWKSFVEDLDGDQLFELMFKNDLSGQLLLEIKEIFDLYKTMETQLTEITSALYGNGIEMFHQRQLQFDKHTEMVEMKKTNTTIGNDVIQKTFYDESQQLFNSVQKIQETFDNFDHPSETDYTTKFNDLLSNVNDHANKFNILVHATWKDLMKMELEHFEEIEEINETVSVTLAEMLSSLKEMAQMKFTEIRGIETQYMENISEIALNYMLDSGKLSEDLQKIFTDEETLLNALAASHDAHVFVINGREDTLVNRVDCYTEDVVQKFKNDAIENNRARILEIERMLAGRREEFDELIVQELPPPDDDDEENESFV